MDAELLQIEQKIEQVVAVCQALREENHVLKTRVAGLEGEKQVLAEKIDITVARLEELMERLPR